MNFRVLGLLVCFIGAALALHSFVEYHEATAAIAKYDLNDMYRRAGMSVDSDALGGEGRRVMAVKRDESRRYITAGLLLGALGLAVAVAAKGDRNGTKAGGDEMAR